MRARARRPRQRRYLLGLVEVEDARVGLAALRSEPCDVGRDPVALGPPWRVLKHRAHDLAVRVDGALGYVLGIEALQPALDLRGRDRVDGLAAELAHDASAGAAAAALARAAAGRPEHVAVALERRRLDPIDVLHVVQPDTGQLVEGDRGTGGRAGDQGGVLGHEPVHLNDR